MNMIHHKRNILLKLFIILCLISFSICIYLITNDYIEYAENNQDNKELVEDVIQENPVTEEFSIDWGNLKSVNPDIIGWIVIEDTKINYPILKDDNKLFYLHHSFNKKYNSNGSIFTTNTNPFIDEETVIYGHNMKNGSMFSNLGKYLNDDFFHSHNQFKIYTPNCDYEATVFSAYSIGVEVENNNIKSLDFNDKINYYKKASKIHIEVDDSISKIVKLSTCSYINAKTNPTDQRYYIVASIIPI